MVPRTFRALAAAAMIAATAACDQTAPAAPGPAPSSQPPPAANQAPTIIAMVSPALAIDDVTTVTVIAEVRDPDGDSVSLHASGCTLGTDVPVPVANGSARIAFVPNGSCSSSITLIATDSRGALLQAAVPFQHTRLRGWYRLVIGNGFYDTPFFYVTLEHSGAAITGTIRDTRGHSGTVDPHQPGTIDAEGRFHLRFKIQSEEDLEISGRIISPDRSLFDDVVIATGVVTSGSLAGRSFKLWREAQF